MMTEEPARKPMSRRRLIWQLVFVFGTLALLIGLGVADPQLTTLFSGTLAVDWGWLMLGILAMVAFWVFQAVAYATAARVVGARTTFANHLRIAVYGEYYSAITPFASGGQPMQIGYYMRYGVSGAKASSIIAVRYIGYISAICACYLCAIAMNGSVILARYPLVFWLTALGFLINFLSIAAVLLLLLRANLVRRVGLWAIRLLTKLPFLRAKQERWIKGFHKGVAEFNIAAECIRNHPWQCLLVFLSLMAGVVCQFSVAYFIYRALGLAEASYFALFAMQVFLYLAVSFAPTPGATGASEGGFYLFFAMVFPQSLLYSAMLLWRLVTYYFGLLVGGTLAVKDELGALWRIRRANRRSGETQPAAAGTPEGENGAQVEGAAPQPADNPEPTAAPPPAQPEEHGTRDEE